MKNQPRPRGRPRSQFKESSAGTLQALDRALAVLRAIADNGSITLSDLARETDVPTATTHRILTTLKNHDYVDFDDVRQDWTIGLEAYRTGLVYLRRNGILEIAKTVMRDLMEQSGETANLGVRDGTEVVFVAQTESDNPIRALFPNGSRASLHASGTGKAILSALDENTLRGLLPKLDSTRFTSRTLTDAEALQRDLAKTRARGWSLDKEERFEGMSCIGAAIYNELGEAWAGISVSGPTVRFGDGQVERLGELVLKAARTISFRSGATTSGHETLRHVVE